MGENAGQATQAQKPAKDITQAAGMTAIVNWDPASATEAWNLARYYGESKLVPKGLDSIADIFVTIAAGRDFGWSPMQSMRGIYVVEGKPSLSADAMVGIAKGSGLCEYFRLVQSDAKIATYETKRKGDPEPVRMSFTIEEAMHAKLLDKKSPWQTYPARMLRNRCKSSLCKEVYEELFFGVYEESEAAEIEVNGAPVVKRTAPPPPNGAPAAADPAGAVPEADKSAKAPAAGETIPVDAARPAQSPAAPVAERARTMDSFEQLFALIEEATTIAGLEALVPDLQKLPKEEQRAIKPDYDKKRAALANGGAA